MNFDSSIISNVHYIQRLYLTPLHEIIQHSAILLSKITHYKKLIIVFIFDCHWVMYSIIIIANYTIHLWRVIMSKKLKLIGVTLFAATGLLACNGGGGVSSGGGDNGGGGGGSITVGPQWTNQIGTTANVNHDDSITYEPISNQLYKLSAIKTLCTISASSNSTIPWDCSTATSNFPTGYSFYNNNLVSDGNGNMLTFGKSTVGTQMVILKYNGSSWSVIPLQNIPNGIFYSTTFYNNGYIYAMSSSGGSGANTQYNFVAFDATTGVYSSSNNVAAVYTGINTPSWQTASIRNNIFYVSNLNTVTATNLTNTSDIKVYTGITSVVTTGATNNNLYVCGGLSGLLGNGINSIALTSNNTWANIGYTGIIPYTGYNIYQGCYSLYAASNKVFVVGYVPNSGTSAAVYTQ